MFLISASLVMHFYITIEIYKFIINNFNIARNI